VEAPASSADAARGSRNDRSARAAAAVASHLQPGPGFKLMQREDRMIQCEVQVDRVLKMTWQDDDVAGPALCLVTGSPSHLRNFVETAPTLRSYGQFAQGSGAFDLPIRKLSYEQFVLGSALADFVIWPYESGSPSRRNFVDSWD